MSHFEYGTLRNRAVWRNGHFEIDQFGKTVTLQSITLEQDHFKIGHFENESLCVMGHLKY